MKTCSKLAIRTPVATILLWFACVILSGLTPANAAKSDWHDLGGGEVRLLAVVDPATNQLSGGIEVRLKEGWKTYWRYPGSSGIPPRFDFSSSTGVEVNEVRFPAPELIGEGRGAYAGYKSSVTFPFSGKFAGKSSGKLELALVIGVCEEVCIPARASIVIKNQALLQSDPVSRNLVDLAMLSVPKTVTVANLIEDMQLLENSMLQVKIDKKFHAANGDLFVEGPVDWYLTPAKRKISDEQTFLLDLSRAPGDADPAAARLKFTLVSEQFAVQSD